MPREGKTSISVDEGTFEELKEKKNDSMTWDTFLLKASRTLKPEDVDTSELKRSEQHDIHLQYVSSSDDGWETYWWVHGKRFLLLPPKESETREYYEKFQEDGWDDISRIEYEDGEVEWKLTKDR